MSYIAPPPNCERNRHGRSAFSYRGSRCNRPGTHALHCTERFFAGHRNHAPRIGLVLHAVADGQRHFVALAGRNHRLALAGVHRHRLFAPYVLARGSGTQGQRRMQVRRRDDVDHIDLVVVGDTIEIFIGVDIAIGDAVLDLPLRNLRRRAGDDAGELAMLGQCQAGASCSLA